MDIELETPSPITINKYLFELADPIDKLGSETDPIIITDHIHKIIDTFEEIIREYGHNGLVEILNSELSEPLSNYLITKSTTKDHFFNSLSKSSYKYLLDIAANNHKRQVAERLLLQHGAKSIQKKFISPIIAALILDGANRKLGEQFSPTILIHGIKSIFEGQVIDFKSEACYLVARMKKTVEDGDSFTQLNKSFIVARNEHWSSFIIQFCIIDKAPTAKFFFIDSKSNWGNINWVFINIIKDLLPMQSIKIYKSNVFLQEDIDSCKIFAITFVRMFHSMLYGKFSKNYDLFNELETITEFNIVKPNADDLEIINISDIPAKLLQTSQFKDDRIGDRPINSKGCMLYQYKGEKVDEKLNKFLTNVNLDAIPLENRESCIEKTIHKFYSMNFKSS